MNESTLIELLVQADATGTPGAYSVTLLPAVDDSALAPEEAPCHRFTLNADDPELTQLLWLTQAAAEDEVVHDALLESLKPTASAAMQGARQLGQLLSAKLFGGPIGPAFAARQTRRALRLHLIVGAEAEPLLALPWELLTDPADPAIFLASQPSFSLVRRLRRMPDLLPPTPLEALRPLRVLLFISSPAGLPRSRQLDCDQEAAAVRTVLKQLIAMGRVDLDVEEIASLAQLQRRLVAKAYDVLHYVGHGGCDVSRGGYLWLEDTQGKGCPVYGPSLARALAGRGLRLAVLSGGLTAAEEIGGPAARLAVGGVVPVAHHRFASVATHLLAQVTTVLTMQTGMRINTGLLAAESLYQALAMESVSVEGALMRTRQTLARGTHGATGGITWSVPALYLRSAVSQPLVSAETAERTLLMATPGAQMPRFDSFAGLPHMARGFVGRRQELLWARETLRRPASRALLLHGCGGIGKTVFATRLADQMLSAGDFDHVFALQVYPGMNAEAVLYQACVFLQQAGLTAFGPLLAAAAPVPEKAGGLARLLSNLRVLVIFDNVENWLDATHTTLADPEIAALILALLNRTTGTTRYLLISRYAFDPLLPQRSGRPLTQLPLGEFSPIQTISYLSQRLLFQQADIRAQLRICQELGGHPQALAFFTARLERDSIDDVLAQLFKVRGAAAVHILLDQLATQLSDEARMLLRRAAVLRRPVPQGCLESLLNHDVDQASRALEELLRFGLLTRVNQCDELIATDEERYQEPVLVREYARIRLEASPDDLAVAWSAAQAWYRHVAQTATDGRLSAFNYLEAWRYAAEPGDGSLMATLAGMAFHQLACMGLWETARAVLVASVAATTEHERAALLHDLGLLAQERGDMATARRHYEESLKIKRELADHASIAQSLHQLGALAQEQGDYAEAQPLYEECLTLFNQIDDRHGAAATLHQLGLLAQEQRDYITARERYKESLELARALHDQAAIAATLHQLGLLAQEQRDYAFAQSCYHTGLEVFHELGDQAGTAATLHQLGMLAQEQGNYPMARRRYEESLRLFHRLGDQGGIMASLHNLNVLAQDQRQARQWWDTAHLTWHRLANWGLRRAIR
jgi:tetratricopeptide (TPR) repeat protein